MRFLVTVICLLLIVHQSPQDTIRQHYESAEAARVAGNLEAAEDEYKAIRRRIISTLGESLLRAFGVFARDRQFRRCSALSARLDGYFVGSCNRLLQCTAV